MISGILPTGDYHGGQFNVISYSPAPPGRTAGGSRYPGQRPVRVLITGGAGFIGSHLADALLESGVEVSVLDNFSSGRPEFLARARAYPGFRLFRGSIVEREVVDEALGGVECVYHFCANPDIRAGLQDPGIDFREETLATFRLLEAMRARGCRKMVFASSSVVYGERPVLPTPEEALGLPISYYGAGKAAGEAMISAAVCCSGLGAVIFRLANVVGPRPTHGVLFDLLAQLRLDPARLRVLGDGAQEKSYLHVDDCVRGVLALGDPAPGTLEVFNLAGEGTVSVKRIVELIAAVTGLNPEVSFGGGRQGWPGDVPRTHLDAARALGRGWKASLDAEAAVRRAAAELWEAG
ncbi:MAG TPA: NAD-dependent epimerase/dehydratase family protein [bacterium]|nr:NAD-dependent epimerase/dehydratase family protein [bacterium]HPJ72289.1 NAD-dependent epimerase/dehydratase family protein [bacterium]HPQ65673.1 NAD-dependent epimerase/dehydratase family protein [bacterium]